MKNRLEAENKNDFFFFYIFKVNNYENYTNLNCHDLKKAVYYCTFHLNTVNLTGNTEILS